VTDGAEAWPGGKVKGKRKKEKGKSKKVKGKRKTG
jgi:hypothetical protein